MPVKPDLVTTRKWRGMFCSEEPQPLDILHYAENCILEAPGVGGTVGTRPGAVGLGEAGGPAGNPANNTILCMFLFRSAAGTVFQGRLVHDNAAGGAHIDTFTGGWFGGTWTTVVNAGVLNAAGLNLAAVTEVFWCEFIGKIVFSDGVNNPWTWDGTGAGGVTRLANAPVSYGRPTIYYAKLFLIKNADRLTLVWSEENQPDTGYEAGGFNNAWKLTQTGGAPLEALAGTNAALFYWRRGSSGRIQGAVTPNFQASGVHDDVSTTVGCADFRSVVVVDEDVWWYDQTARFRVWSEARLLDVTPVPIGQRSVDPSLFASVTWVRPGANSLFQQRLSATGAAYTQTGDAGAGSGRTQVAFTLQDNNTVPGEGTGLLLFDARTHLAIGFAVLPTNIRCLTRGLAAQLAGAGVQWENGECLMYAGPTAGITANTCWQYGVSLIPLDSNFNGAWTNNRTFTCIAVTALMGWAPDQESVFDRIDVEMELDGDAGMAAVPITVRWVSSEYPTTSTAPAGQAQNFTPPSAAYVESHLAYGISTVARWCRAAVSWVPGGGDSTLSLRTVRAWRRALARSPGAV